MAMACRETLPSRLTDLADVLDEMVAQQGADRGLE